MTPILRAVEAQNLELVKFYYKKGADLLAVDNVGRSALHILFDTKENFVNKKLLKFLLKSNCDPNRTCSSGHSSLQHLVSREHLVTKMKVAKVLIKYGASAYVTTTLGNTILHLAALVNPNLDLIKFFIAQGVDTESMNLSGFNFLDYLLRKDRSCAIELMKYLLLQDRLYMFEMSVVLDRTIVSDTEMNEISQDCINEFIDLGAKILDNHLYCSYLDLFSLNQKLLIALCRYESIELALIEFDDTNFVMYGEYIKKKFDEALDLCVADSEYTKILLAAGLDFYIISNIIDFYQSAVFRNKESLKYSKE